MNPTSMDNSMRSALAQSPFSSQESNSSGLRDALAQVDKFIRGGGAAGANANANANATSQVPALTGQVAQAAPEAQADPLAGLLSGPARLFQKLGVDPNNYDMSVQRDEIKFKLQMDDEQMSTGAEGSNNTSSRSLSLEIKLSTTHGTVNSNGQEVTFDKTSFELNFSYSETVSGDQAGNAKEAFAGKKDEFIKAIMEELGKLAELGSGEGGLDASDPEALLKFGQELGQKLFDLMDGTMQVAQEEPKRATYEDPMKAARGRLESMQQVADLLTKQAEEMAKQMAEKPTEIGAPPSPSNSLEDAPVKAELAASTPSAEAAASVEAHEEEKPVEKSLPKPQPNMKAFLATQPQASSLSSLNAVA